MATTDRDPLEIFKEYLTRLQQDCHDPQINILQRELEALGYAISCVSHSCTESTSGNLIVWHKSFTLRDPQHKPIVETGPMAISIAKDRYSKPDPNKKKHEPEPQLQVTAQDLRFLRSLKIDTTNL